MRNLKSHKATLSIDTPIPPPHWALLERELLRVQSLACRKFFAHYFDENGYLLCVPRWGGDDGPDDAAENQLNWTMLHALGASDEVLELFKLGWEGHLRQYTEAKTVEVPLARDGMYYKEFPTVFDWFHHGEGFSAFFLQGLSDPYDRYFEQRSRRYAGLYMGEDPQADNYDPEQRIIRSMFNGSRGPLLRKATALDWAGDYIDVADLHLAHGERSHAEMLAHFEEYTDVVGDNPLNLEATHLGFVAYAITGEDRYRDWVVDYVDAWLERTEQNSGIIPSNVGLDGTLGGACDGKWYGGVYGWGFTVTVPQTGARANRPACYSRPCYGFAHALQLTGDRSYGEAWGNVLDAVRANAKEEDGQTVYPRMYGDEGWYDFAPKPMNRGAQEVWFWSMREADRERVADDPWVQYVTGENDNYPEAALAAEFARLRDRVARMRDDASTKDTRLSDVSLPMNPALTDQLTQLMMGGLPTGRRCHTMHCRLRYFDPEKRRAGVPPDVGALVERMTDDSVTVSLVNLSPLHERTVVIQGGGYAEHTLERVSCEGGETVDVDTSYGADRTAFALRLAPSAGCRLQIQQQRFAHRPTLAFPWDRR